MQAEEHRILLSSSVNTLKLGIYNTQTPRFHGPRLVLIKRHGIGTGPLVSFTRMSVHIGYKDFGAGGLFQ